MPTRPSPQLLYVLTSIILILLAFIAPYVVFYSERGWGLYVFWLILAAVELAATAAYVRGRGWASGGS